MSERLRGLLAFALVAALAGQLLTYGWIAWRHAAFWSATGWWTATMCGG